MGARRVRSSDKSDRLRSFTAESIDKPMRVRKAAQTLQDQNVSSEYARPKHPGHDDMRRSNSSHKAIFSDKTRVHITCVCDAPDFAPRTLAINILNKEKTSRRGCLKKLMTPRGTRPLKVTSCKFVGNSRIRI
ncbi:hypothetical protein RRG08_043082 [Elysia crispata]|uniref:Uncharacterized protein n=1 Tax=Elysia crispata TaxID=231223 RepID=A0AAE1CP67_9GAST|nr:hypothetical protein RRG08_043082 [Elysia crispata]